MKAYLLWKWKRFYKEFVKQLIIACGILFVLLLAYLFLKTYFFKGIGYVNALPDEMRLFLGLYPSVSTGNFNFFLFFAMMFINVYVAFCTIERTIIMSRRNEDSGVLASLYHQTLSGTLYCLYELCWNVITGIGTYLSLMLWLLLCVLIGGGNGTVRVAGLKMMLRMTATGTLVLLLLIGISYALAIFSRETTLQLADKAANWLVFGTIVIGSIYKLFPLIMWVAAYLGKEIQLSTLTGVFKILRIVSPLSYWNPFLSVSGLEWFGISAFYLILAVGMMGYSVLRYGKSRNPFC